MKLKLMLLGITVVCLATVALYFAPANEQSELAANHLGERIGPTDSTKSNAGNSADGLNSIDRSSHKKRNLVNGRDISIVSEEPVAAGDVLKRTAEEFYVNADRVAYVQIESDSLLSNLSFSRAYMYAESGNLPAEVQNNEEPDLILNVFADREYLLNIKHVEILENNGRQNLVISGQVDGDDESTFRFTTTGDGSMFSGFVDTPDRFTRLDTWKISSLTAVAEFDRSTVELNSGPID